MNIMTTRRGHYVPSNAQQFREFMQNLLAYVYKKKTAWNIPTDRYNELSGAFDSFNDFLEAASTSPTPANIHRRQESQAAVTALLRAFVNQFLRFPPITDADRIEMGIPVHDTIRTDHFVVTENVDFVIHLSAIRELVIQFWQQGADHRAKPTGYEGAVIIWGIADAPPENPEELTHHIMASRTPFTLHFDEEERGKTVYVALAWQNERGIRGAWSEYKTAIVP